MKSWRLFTPASLSCARMALRLMGRRSDDFLHACSSNSGKRKRYQGIASKAERTLILSERRLSRVEMRAGESTEQRRDVLGLTL